MNAEEAILHGLLHNEDFIRKVLPYVKDEYFTSDDKKIVFNEIKKYFTKYDQLPNAKQIYIECEKRDDIYEKTFEDVTETLKAIAKRKETNTDWLVDTTEDFCREQAIYNAINESIDILDGNSKKYSRGAIPDLLSDALAVSFDTHVGHDYFDDWEKRYDYYHTPENKIPFNLEWFNKITKGGVKKKTLNMIIAGTHVGKSLMLCHFAAGYLMKNYKVLYITLEMDEDETAQRIDTNLMNVSIHNINDLSKEEFEQKIKDNKKKTAGNLVIKEFPTSFAGVNEFNALLNELKLKKSFVPDIVIVDYLNICSSSRHKSADNIYTYYKSVAEELRGFAVKNEVVLWTATQFNRSGFSSSDPNMDDQSDSFGAPMTADFMIAAIRDEEMDGLNQILIKQLKSRYNDLNLNKRFLIGVDRLKFKLYDLDEGVSDYVFQGLGKKKKKEDEPVMDNTDFGLGLKREHKRRDFSDIT